MSPGNHLPAIRCSDSLKELMMSFHFLWKRLITKEVPLSSHPLSILVLPPLAFSAKPAVKITHFCTQTAPPSTTSPTHAFNANPNTKNTHFCTQTAAPSTTPPDLGTFREFILSKCGFTEEDITKVCGRRNGLLRIPIYNLDHVLELLYSCGLTTPAQIRKVLLRNPEILLYKSETKVKTMLNFLRTFMKEEHVSKLVYNYPVIFNFGEHRVRSTVSLLQKLGVEGEFLSELLCRQPRLLGTTEEKVTRSFKQAEDLGVKKGSKKFLSVLRAIFGVADETIDRRLQCLKSLGFSEKQIMEISSKRASILGLSEERLKRQVDFVVNYLGLPLADLVKHSSMFTYSSEKRMIPRYRVIEALKSMRLLKTKMSLPCVFNLSEKSFLEKYVNSNVESSLVLRDIIMEGKLEN